MSAAAGRERFVWPPRPLEDRAPGAEPLSALPVSTELRPREPAIAYPELVVERPGRLGRLARVCREVEAAWLGFAGAPLAVRAAEAGWLPDAPGTYCPRCGSTIGPNEVCSTPTAGRPAGDCPACRPRKLPWERTVRLGEYTGLLRSLVHEIKFTAWQKRGLEVGRMLGRSLAAELERAGVDHGRTVLVAMPTTYWRRTKRGIDHARVLTRGVRDVTGLPIVSALERSHRPSQVSVPASRRGANVAGSIRPAAGIDLGGLTVVVVDDVRTTGATMAAACRAVGACGRGGAQRNDQTHISGFDGVWERPRVWAALAAVARQPGRRAGGGAIGAEEGPAA